MHQYMCVLYSCSVLWSWPWQENSNRFLPESSSRQFLKKIIHGSPYILCPSILITFAAKTKLTRSKRASVMQRCETNIRARLVCVACAPAWWKDEKCCRLPGPPVVTWSDSSNRKERGALPSYIYCEVVTELFECNVTVVCLKFVT